MRPRAAHAPPRERDDSTPPTRCLLRARAACTPPRHDAVKLCPRTPAVRTQDCASDGVTAGTLLAPVSGHGPRGVAPGSLRRHSRIYARPVLRETPARGDRPPHRRPRRARDVPRAGKRARASFHPRSSAVIRTMFGRLRSLANSLPRFAMKRCAAAIAKTTRRRAMSLERLPVLIDALCVAKKVD